METICSSLLSKEEYFSSHNHFGLYFRHLYGIVVERVPYSKCYFELRTFDAIHPLYFSLGFNLRVSQSFFLLS
ncbi:hypothetical protein UVUMRFZT_CDS0166 [Staphylococcus phage LJLAME001]